MINQKIAIIGAGLTGSILAKKLAKNNQVTIFDKSRGLGGRMSTRRTAKFQFDHGAQYFTAKTPEFQDFVNELIKEEIVAQWQGKVISLNSNHSLETCRRYVAIPAMNQICKFLCSEVKQNLGTEISEISFAEKKWNLKSKSNDEFKDFDFLILTIPPAQATNLLPSNFSHFEKVKNTKMFACFTLMLGLTKDPHLNFDGAFANNSSISWISKNNSKPGRNQNHSLVITTNNEWAEKNIEGNQQEIKIKLLKELNELINLDNSLIEHTDIHRWLYAAIPPQINKKSLVDHNLNLAIAGDWLIEGRVESCFLSAADLLQNKLFTQ
jgi:renalase